MARTRVNINRSGLIALMRDPAVIAGRTKAVEAACNSESSWGGYASAVQVSSIRARGRVWSYARQDGGGKTERAQRMIRNLDAQ